MDQLDILYSIPQVTYRNNPIETPVNRNQSDLGSTIHRSSPLLNRVPRLTLTNDSVKLRREPNY